MFPSVAPRGSARLLAVLALLVALVGLAAAPAAATEAEGGAGPTEAGEGEHVTIDDIGTRNEVSDQFRPEEAEAPPFMRFFYVPLIIGGLAIVGALLLLYLTWQPRFAAERRSKRRR